MLVYNENFKEIEPIFKETCDKAKFVSFDCEMTGVTLESKTDGTKFDTQQFRYFKQREVVKKFDLIQLGFTFYLERIKKNENEKEKKDFDEKLNEFYVERTFTFYLFKNSKLKMINNNIFDSEMLCHPATLKFLNENHFDLNILVSKGIHYNKLNYREKIKQTILKEKFLMANNSMFLSKENENHLKEILIEIKDFLLKENTTGKKETKIFTLKNKQTMIFLLGCNLKKLFNLDNFIILKDKNKQNSIKIEKKAHFNKDGFKNKFETSENFNIEIKENTKLIYENRFNISFEPNEENTENLIKDELGFSNLFEYLINKKIPLIGHNIYFDMMFLYDKLIDDLPEKFYDFKKEIHKHFPKIYDTKFISSKFISFFTKGEKSNNTKLENLYKILIKNNFNTYIKFYADTREGFGLYNDMEKSLLHDAGFDSIYTGRCFVLLNKALENNFKIGNVKENINMVGEDKIKQDAIVIKYGFINNNTFVNEINLSKMSLVECCIKWNTDEENEEEFEKNENNLINEKFKNVFHVKFNKNQFDGIISIYDCAETFENEEFNINIVKSNDCSAFICFECSDDFCEVDEKKLDEIINKIKNEKKDKIEDIKKINDFYKDYKNIIGF